MHNTLPQKMELQIVYQCKVCGSLCEYSVYALTPEYIPEGSNKVVHLSQCEYNEIVKVNFQLPLMTYCQVVVNEM